MAPFDERRSASEYWRTRPRGYPSAVVKPEPGHESVWDYPRPPRVEPVARRLRVEFAGLVIAETTQGVRVVETASPPVYYIPPGDVRREYLEPSAHRTVCEWKGVAWYWTIRVGTRCVESAVWSYPEPAPGFEAIRECLAFYPSLMDACYVGQQRVTPQPGRYYGGWITSDVVGPFKGEPGTENW